MVTTMSESCAAKRMRRSERRMRVGAGAVEEGRGGEGSVATRWRVGVEGL